MLFQIDFYLPEQGFVRRINHNKTQFMMQKKTREKCEDLKSKLDSLGVNQNRCKANFNEQKQFLLNSLKRSPKRSLKIVSRVSHFIDYTKANSAPASNIIREGFIHPSIWFYDLFSCSKRV